MIECNSVCSGLPVRVTLRIWCSMIPSSSYSIHFHISVHTQDGQRAFCEHVAGGRSVVFAHCMCRDCFVEYLTTSGGIYEV